jgi:hypothetical protein
LVVLPTAIEGRSPIAIAITPLRRRLLDAS